MSQQNINLMNSSTNSLISSSNGNNLKQPDLSDRDTGDLAYNITKQQQQQKLYDKATKIIETGIDKSKELVTTIKKMFKWRPRPFPN